MERMEPISHYYGDTVRKLLITCGLIMLITLPFLKSNLSSPLFYSLLFILILTFFAGLTNPKQKLVMVGDIIVSMAGFIVFANQAVTQFTGFFNLFFATNFILSVLFIIAFYLSVKTTRGVEFSKSVAANVFTRIKKVKRFNASEDAPKGEKKELSEEERRRKRFLRDE